MFSPSFYLEDKFPFKKLFQLFFPSDNIDGKEMNKRKTKHEEKLIKKKLEKIMINHE